MKKKEKIEVKKALCSSITLAPDMERGKQQRDKEEVKDWIRKESLGGSVMSA